MPILSAWYGHERPAADGRRDSSEMHSVIAAAWVRSLDGARDRQVFWLSARLGWPAPSQMLTTSSGLIRVAWPITAAAPQRIYTVFPIVLRDTRRNLSNVVGCSDSRRIGQHADISQR